MLSNPLETSDAAPWIIRQIEEHRPRKIGRSFSGVLGDKDHMLPAKVLHSTEDGQVFRQGNFLGNPQPSEPLRVMSTSEVWK